MFEAQIRRTDRNGGTKRVLCDMPVELPVTTEELDLLVTWLGDVVADLHGSSDGEGKKQRKMEPENEK